MNYSGPSTQAQRDLITALTQETQEGDLIIKQFLDSNHINTIEQLTNSKACTLIDMLKEDK